MTLLGNLSLLVAMVLCVVVLLLLQQQPSSSSSNVVVAVSLVLGANAPSSSSETIFHDRFAFRNCSYEQRIPPSPQLSNNRSSSSFNNNTNLYKFERIPLNEQVFSQFRELPFGFGCESVQLPQTIVEDDFAIYIYSNGIKNSEFYSPISTSKERYDLCEKYQSIQESCVDLMCSDSSSTQHYIWNDTLVNYCQYCRNAKGFVEYHLMLHDSEIEKPHGGVCANISKFPSAFYCGIANRGIPLNYQSGYFIKYSRNPYVCYCASEDRYSSSCEHFWNDQDTAFAKMTLILILMIPAFLVCLIAYALPLMRSFIRKQNLTIANIFSVIIMEASCCSMLVGGFAAPFHNALNYTTLSSSLFIYS